MTDQLEKRRRRRESLITVAFTIFSVFMIYVTTSLHWPPVYILIIMSELFFVWWGYVTGYRDHMTRAIILSLCMSVNVFLYGIQGENFPVLIPTLCTYIILISMFEMQPALDIGMVNILLLFFYHAFIKRSFVLSDNRLERNRISLQLLSLVVLLALVLYRMRRHREEDEDLVRLEKQVERVQKIKDDFVVNTSHELRTPIGTISGMSEILLQEDLPENIHHEVLDIQMTSIELQTIVTDILDYAALEADTLSLNPRAYNITSTLNDVMNMTVFQNREKNLELVFDCDPNIPCSLYGDEQQLRRTLNNLIGNAIKFTSEGGVTVSVTYRPEDYGINLIVKVKDTGIGLTQEEQERIFQGFYQADSDRNRRVEGMGLGLTISYSIIKKMGGFLTVKSQAGKGSEFSFSIPQKVLDERPCIALTHPGSIDAIWYFNFEESDRNMRDDVVENIRHLSGYLGIAMQRCSSLAELKRRISQTKYTHLLISMEEYTEDPLYFDDLAMRMTVILIVERDQQLPETAHMHFLYKPYNAMMLAEIFNGGDLMSEVKAKQSIYRFVAPDAKILVVDDNLMNLKVVEGLLRKYRIKISAASSGEEALSLIDSKDYDLVFMDHMMPGMDGIECLHHIRAKRGIYFAKVPIVALTANAISGSREMFLEEGFNDFVAKPIDNTLLDHVLQKYIPKEKQFPADEQEASAEAPGQKDDPFAAMEGIDMNLALTYCGGDLEDYIELARVYCESGTKYYRNLVDYHAQQDWKNYSIVAHALKSTSKTIGATKLSDIAFKEEIASKDGDVKTIDQYHDAMLKEYRRVLDVLHANPRIGHADVHAPEEAGGSGLELKWEDVYRELSERLQTFESRSIEEYIRQNQDAMLDGRTLGEATEQLLAHVEEFDFEGAIAELEKIGGERQA